MSTRRILAALSMTAIAIGGCSSDTRRSVATDLQTAATAVGSAAADAVDNASEVLARNIATQQGEEQFKNAGHTLSGPLTCIAFKSGSFDPAKQVVYLMAIDGAKFRKPVVPGDRLTLSVEVIRHKSAVWKQRGVATVDGAVVAEGEFLATVMSNEKPVAS